MGYRLNESEASDRDRGPSESGGAPSRRRQAVRRTVSVLPTLFTLANLVCGFLAVFFASRPADTPMPFNWTPITLGAALVFVGMFFDAVDGRIARLTGHTSELGEQLDSMADMVTFGIAPAFIAVMLVRIGTPFVSAGANEHFGRAALVVAAIYVCCAALRLARFNIETPDEEQDKMHFKGMPSPGAAGTIAALVLLHQHFLADYTRRHPEDTPLASWPPEMLVAGFAMMGITLLTGLAMVSRLRYVHFSNRFIRGRAPFTQVMRIIAVLALAAWWPQAALAGAFTAYALSAPVTAAWRKVRGSGAGVSPADGSGA